MTEQTLLKNLEQFGFTASQARLYLAGLKLGRRALMARLAKLSGVRRTTAYYLMEELLRRGFFTKKKLGKRNYYITASPKRLLEMTRERERLVRRLMPELKNLADKSARYRFFVVS